MHVHGNSMATSSLNALLAKSHGLEAVATRVQELVAAVPPT